MTVGDAELEAARGVYGIAQFKDPAGWPHERVYGQSYSTGGWQHDGPHAGFESDKYGIGHTVHGQRRAGDRDLCRNVMDYRWYIQGLRKGMGLFWRFKNNNLSHNIAYGINPNHRVGDTSSMVPHIGIYCKTLDDVGISSDIGQDRYPERIEMTLGRHMQDPVISFYSKTPAGFTIECIWGEELDVLDAPYVKRRADGLNVWGHRSPNGSPHI